MLEGLQVFGRSDVVACSSPPTDGVGACKRARMQLQNLPAPVTLDPLNDLPLVAPSLKWRCYPLTPKVVVVTGQMTESNRQSFCD